MDSSPPACSTGKKTLETPEAVSLVGLSSKVDLCTRLLYQATWEREFKLPRREAGPPDLYDDRVDWDQQVVNKESLCLYLVPLIGLDPPNTLVWQFAT